MSVVGFIFPHQLFASHPVLREKPAKVCLIEDSLFFGDSRYPLNLHRQKIGFHIDTLDEFEKRLDELAMPFERVRYLSAESALPALFAELKKSGVTTVKVCEPHDYILSKRLHVGAGCSGMELRVLPTPAFLNTREDNQAWRSTHKRWNMATFYKHQRQRLDILMEGDKPVGGQWSFDHDNRKRLPKNEIPEIPALPLFKPSTLGSGALLDDRFPDSPGQYDASRYPTTPAAASRWLTSFYEERFRNFGEYEDAIVQGQNWLYHSVLTPMLNTGLLVPDQVVDTAIDAAVEYAVPINSLEGFVRQIVGWREFMRATYDDLGVEMRKGNHWEHERNMPQAFYTATTGIEPIDDVIRRVLDTGYCHHIERLMVLGGFMFLCEIKPDDVYAWFMEMFVDSYDWVMVPNVYAMSQHADGGNITTKPYFSGSNYIIKMSHYRKGEWSIIWDALFWRWVIRNQKRLVENHRWSMIVRNAERMAKEKQKEHIRVADAFLHSLHRATN
jgi:deoxyribodipyrimidine photolyase-related protein